jgi:hypothetical protein
VTAEDPYRAPLATVEDQAGPQRSPRWWRVIAWGVLVFVVGSAIHFIGGLTMGNWEIYGGTIEEAIVNARWTRRLVASVVVFVLYLVFLHGTQRRHFLQLIGVFVVAQVVDLPLTIAITGSFENLVSFSSLGINLLVCLLAYAVWYLNVRRTG